MQIIKINNDYSVPFIIKGDKKNIASGVSVKFVVSPELSIQSLSFGTSVTIPGVDTIVIGTLLPNQSITVNIVVKVLVENLVLNITGTVMTTSSETNLTNNVKTVNLIAELNGVLCTELGSCTSGPADNLGNHTATIDLNLANNNILNENIPVHISYNAALLALGAGRKFRWATTNLDGVPSPNNSNIGLT